MNNVTLCEICPVSDDCNGKECIYDTTPIKQEDHDDSWLCKDKDPWNEDNN